MRKNLLSLSIAAMIGGLGLASSAGAVSIAGTASALTASGTGVGHILLVPYFSTQNGNATLLSIVNSDTVNGKAVKVRFRSAANSDDVFDFQLFLSPSDVWTANVSQNANGLSQLSTGDMSCTLPSATTLNSTPFVTNRLPGTSTTFTAAQQASWTREGYVEILNMADIPASTTTTTLSYAITHANGVPPGCPSQSSTAAVFTALSVYNGATSVMSLYGATGGLANPTGGLFGGATIINTSGASVAWSGNDYALMANGPANMVFSPQMATTASTDIGTVANWTADPLLVGGAITAADYDLPDLSTPYVTGAATPIIQADLTASAFATTSVMNEYLVTASIAAATDWTFTLPTRRYAVAYNYAGTTSAPGNASSNKLWYTSGSTYFFPGTGSLGNVTVGTSNPLLLCVSGMSLTGYGQEEQTLTPGGFVISPNQLAPGFNLCGEASVLSFSANTVLGATVAPSSVATTLPSSAGWLSVSAPGLNAGYGLPILGASYEQATGPVVAGKSTNFGISYQHRYTRGIPATN